MGHLQKVLYTAVYPRRENGAEEVFGHIMTENFPIWWKIYIYRLKKLSKLQIDLIPRTHTWTYQVK